MLRLISRAPFRSFAHSSSLSQKFNNVVEGRTEISRTVTNLEGHSQFRFGDQSFQRSTQVQIVNALRLGERDRASDLLSRLGHQSDSLRADDFVYILDYCARSPDPLFVMETCRFMKENEINMNSKSCTFIIQALSRGGYLEEAFNTLTFLGGTSGTSVPMYNIFLNGCADMQNSVHANYCLELMESRLVGKSEITYWVLLKLAVLQQNLSAVHEIWKDCTKYYSPSIICLRKFIWSFTRLGDLGSAYDALQRMVVLVFHGNASVRISNEGRYQVSRLDIPIPLNNIEKHCMESENSAFKEEKDHKNLELLPHVASIPVFGNQHFAAKGKLHSDFGMENVEIESSRLNMLKEIATVPVMKVLRWSFSDVIHACAQSGKCELAEQLFLEMQDIGVEPSPHTYDGFIKAIVSVRGAIYGMKVVRAMEKRNLRPYGTTLATLSSGFSRILELNLAGSLLDQIVIPPRNVYPFNAFLAACDVMDQPEHAVRALAKMKHLQLKPNIRTYELLFSLFGNVNAPYEMSNMLSKADSTKRIRAIEMDMVNNGVQHSHLSIQNLLRAFGAEGMIREMIQYLNVAERQFFNAKTYAGTEIYNTVLHALVEAKESDMVIEVFRNMKSYGLPLDASTYNIMIDCCSTIRCFRSACALVSLMLRDGFSPTICTYTALIKTLLANEDFEEALNLVEQASTEGTQPDVLFFNTILQEACWKGRIDVIELIIERMHREKVQPDPTTCYFTFSAYVDHGFFSTAMEALQVLSMRMISEDENTLQEKRVEFEDLIMDEDPEAESRIVKYFKECREHISAALLNLRWCGISGHSISWSPDESLWARRLSSSWFKKKS